MSRACVLIVLLALAAPAGSAEPLGRFFFTPAERAELDAARIRKTPPAPPPAPPPAYTPPVPEAQVAPPEPRVITYGGMVRRSDGKSVVWLNDQPMDAKDALAELPLTGRVRADGAMSLEDPRTGRSIELKVGQSIEVHSGGVTERRRAPQTAPPAEADPASVQPAPASAPAQR